MKRKRACMNYNYCLKRVGKPYISSVLKISADINLVKVLLKRGNTG